MKLNVSKELNALRQMTMRELRGKFAEVFGEATGRQPRLADPADHLAPAGAGRRRLV
jgi:hypothetical protein